jgi:flagellar FliL protein
VLAVGGIGYKMFAPKKVGLPTGGDVVTMDPTTLNLQGGHYLKVAIAIQLVAGKASATDFMTSKAAELTIDEFSDRPVESLSTNAARKKLVTDLRAKIKSAYEGEVFDVFLTQFVTQ